MAINRPTAKKRPVVNLPPELDVLVTDGFALQQCRDIFGRDFKDVGEKIKEYLETNKDGFTIDMGVGFACEQGKVTYTERSNWKVDEAALEQALANGDITISQLLACVSTWKASDLEKTLGTTKFDTIAANNPTEYLTLRATNDYKAEAELMVRGWQQDLQSGGADTGPAADADEGPAHAEAETA